MGKMRLFPDLIAAESCHWETIAFANKKLELLREKILNTNGKTPRYSKTKKKKPKKMIKKQKKEIWIFTQPDIFCCNIEMQLKYKNSI